VRTTGRCVRGWGARAALCRRHMAHTGAAMRVRECRTARGGCAGKARRGAVWGAAPRRAPVHCQAGSQPEARAPRPAYQMQELASQAVCASILKPEAAHDAFVCHPVVNQRRQRALEVEPEPIHSTQSFYSLLGGRGGRGTPRKWPSPFTFSHCCVRLNCVANGEK
jgi:hypothetical protein